MLSAVDWPRKSKIRSCTPIAANVRMSPAILFPVGRTRPVGAVGDGMPVSPCRRSLAPRNHVPRPRSGVSAFRGPGASHATVAARPRWRRPGASRRRAGTCAAARREDACRPRLPCSFCYGKDSQRISEYRWNRPLKLASDWDQAACRRTRHASLLVHRQSISGLNKTSFIRRSRPATVLRDRQPDAHAASGG